MNKVFIFTAWFGVGKRTMQAVGYLPAPTNQCEWEGAQRIMTRALRLLLETYGPSVTIGSVETFTECSVLCGDWAKQVTKILSRQAQDRKYNLCIEELDLPPRHFTREERFSVN